MCVEADGANRDLAILDDEIGGSQHANRSGLAGLIDGNEHRGAACQLAVVTFPEAC
ncbi:MAG: hypothetical protein JWQ86_4041 [Mycobacterium sp.]|nr:hypothetical protein [Mycobacterium sp.]MDT5216793.1 hypothetical protein [Mycobacterium sp.]